MESATSILARRDRMRLPDGRTLRLLSAMEVLEARREAQELCREGRERALCANACLLARALERRGKPLYENGGAVLRAMRTAEIEALARTWAEFDRRENPSLNVGEERLETLKKVWSTRRRNACAGACSAPSECCRTTRRPGE